MGSNSAVGTASRNLQFSKEVSRDSLKEEIEATHSPSIGNSKATSAKAMNRLRSVFEMAPMGLISALEQSYLVRYPRRLE